MAQQTNIFQRLPDGAAATSDIYDKLAQLSAKTTTGISKTVPLAKLTPGGTAGSITYVNGLATASVDPT